MDNFRSTNGTNGIPFPTGLSLHDEFTPEEPWEEFWLEPWTHPYLSLNPGDHMNNSASATTTATTATTTATTITSAIIDNAPSMTPTTTATTFSSTSSSPPVTNSSDTAGSTTTQSIVKVTDRKQKGVKRFSCNECQVQFTRSNDLKRHQQRHEFRKLYGEKGMLRGADSPSEHASTLTTTEYIQCTECPMQFTRCSSYRRHCHRRHFFLLSKTNVQPMKSAMTQLQLQLWEWCQELNTPIDPVVLMNTKKRRR